MTIEWLILSAHQVRRRCIPCTPKGIRVRSAESASERWSSAFDFGHPGRSRRRPQTGYD